MMRRDDTEERFGQLLGLGNAWHVVEAWFEVSCSSLMLKVEESVQTGTMLTCHDQVEPMEWRHTFNKECVIFCT